ncbi:hypothetical protein SLS56_003075 [Neofusicoccum ribis]|uniref:Uncharacterized protein n=1 Tax=Neofusicoccum ribis TaxID=45134 RepID=A0ABR3T1A3_9PEZI
MKTYLQAAEPEPQKPGLPEQLHPRKKRRHELPDNDDDILTRFDNIPPLDITEFEQALRLSQSVTDSFEAQFQEYAADRDGFRSGEYTPYRDYLDNVGKDFLENPAQILSNELKKGYNVFDSMDFWKNNKPTIPTVTSQPEGQRLHGAGPSRKQASYPLGVGGPARLRDSTSTPAPQFIAKAALPALSQSKNPSSSSDPDGLSSMIPSFAAEREASLTSTPMSTPSGTRKCARTSLPLIRMLRDGSYQSPEDFEEQDPKAFSSAAKFINKKERESKSKTRFKSWLSAESGHCLYQFVVSRIKSTKSKWHPGLERCRCCQACALAKDGPSLCIVLNEERTKFVVLPN